MDMRSLPVALCMSLVMSGCLTMQPTPADEVDPAALEAVGTELVCPDGGTTVRAPAVCVNTIERPGQAFTEPKLSIDPTDPNRLVIGVNAGNAAVLDPEAQLPPDPSPFRSEVFLSTDAGATWRHLRPPVPLMEEGRYGSADTDAIIDHDGTIHVTALSITARPDNSFALHVFHTASQDDGATWSTPALFSTDGQDNRNWNTIAPDNTFLVTWSRPAASEVAWSRDDGATWQRLTVEGCRSPKPITYADDVPLLVCRNNGTERLEILRLDLEAGTSETVATPLDAHPFAFSRAGDGALWLGAVVDGRRIILRSIDGGADWSEVAVLDDIAGLPADPLAVRALTADPWGNAHLLLEALRGPCQEHLPLEGRGACPSETAFGGSVDHLVLSPSGDARPLVRLTPPEMRSPPAVAVGSWDDYHSIAFGADHGYLVWTYDKGLDITRVVRAGPDAEAEGNSGPR